jgi:hypothetical protein
VADPYETALRRQTSEYVARHASLRSSYTAAKAFFSGPLRDALTSAQNAAEKYNIQLNWSLGNFGDEVEDPLVIYVLAARDDVESSVVKIEGRRSGSQFYALIIDEQSGERIKFYLSDAQKMAGLVLTLSVSSLFESIEQEEFGSDHQNSDARLALG